MENRIKYYPGGGTICILLPCGFHGFPEVILKDYMELLLIFIPIFLIPCWQKKLERFTRNKSMQIFLLLKMVQKVSGLFINVWKVPRKGLSGYRKSDSSLKREFLPCNKLKFYGKYLTSNVFEISMNYHIT